MRIAVFGTQAHERSFLNTACGEHPHALTFLEPRLDITTAPLASGHDAVSIFVSDKAGADVLEAIHALGVRCLLLRCAGFNHVDVRGAERLGITILRVPAYSPHAVAEHTVGLMLTLNRKFHRAFVRVREQNFSLQGLLGFDMHGKTVGLIGTGKIGECVCRIVRGMGCRVLASDPTPNPECAAMGVEYLPANAVMQRADIVSLHCPLTPRTRHLINERTLGLMKRGVMIVNTSRGAVIDTRALINALKAGHVGSVGLDVYEEEGDLFFRDLSEEAIQDDVFVRLMTFPNVLITAHQGFFTREACEAIAYTTLQNATDFERGSIDENRRVTTALLAPDA